MRPVLDAFRTGPSPRGQGRTRHNLAVLTAAAADDLDVARLAEAHLDALTILGELDGTPPPAGSCWGVYAAESATDRVHAKPVADGGWRLSGRKPFCSGAVGPCTHALVTAHADDGRRLFALDLGADGVAAHPQEWRALGMRGGAAATVDLDDVPADPIGGPGAYLDRPGFWHGAVAAAWFFPPLVTGEDVALVRRLDEGGHRVVRDRAHPVRTSARTVGRAAAGFASHLRGLSGMHVIPVAPGTSPAEPRCSRRRGREGGPAVRIS